MDISFNLLDNSIFRSIRFLCNLDSFSHANATCLSVVSNVSLYHKVELFELSLFVSGDFVENFEDHEKWSDQSEETV